MQARGSVSFTCMYAYLRVILKHNLLEYDRRMKWDWLRFFINRRCRILELLPLTSWLYAPHPVSNRPPGVRDTSRKEIPLVPQCPWTRLLARS